ncbi:uncharacterized protein LOC143564212 [Bidens hawaiensis]|uniref:uncharacterized protein LOC143564212 n=1 Tax=Bidens hawaiensis TaxID=980011 RepID=UPI00404A6D31
MPRYYCDYCDTYLTHDSPSVKKQHNAGYKHKTAYNHVFSFVPQGYPGMPPMLAPPGAPTMPGQVAQVNPSIPGQVNNGVLRPITLSAPMMAPGISGNPTSGAPPPMFAPTMYQPNPTSSAPAPGGFESPNASAHSQETNH